MKFRLISAAVVETDQGYLLIPVGLFKYKVVSSRHEKEFTFWSEFCDDPEGTTEGKTEEKSQEKLDTETETPQKSKRAVVLSLSRPPYWDDGSEITREDFGDIAEVIGEGFALKGYQAIFTTIPDPNAHWSVPLHLLETEGGRWLDEVSRDKNLSDGDRDRLWSKALESFKAANSSTFAELRTPGRDSEEPI